MSNQTSDNKENCEENITSYTLYTLSLIHI